MTEKAPRDCIMVVESDVLVRQPLAEYLRECGYQVVEATNAAEARQLLSAGTLAINIVLADAGGPKGSGPEESGFVLAGWIRENFPGIDVTLTGSVAKAAQEAGNLCEDGPGKDSDGGGLARPYEHRLVLDYIRQLLAARTRNDDTE